MEKSYTVVICSKYTLIAYTDCALKLAMELYDSWVNIPETWVKVQDEHCNTICESNNKTSN